MGLLAAMARMDEIEAEIAQLRAELASTQDAVAKITENRVRWTPIQRVAADLFEVHGSDEESESVHPRDWNRENHSEGSIVPDYLELAGQWLDSVGEETVIRKLLVDTYRICYPSD